MKMKMILKKKKVAPLKITADSPKEEFLEHKRKKRWMDSKTGHYYFMVYARALYVTWGTRENWTWDCFKETSPENIEVAKLTHVCWLDVRGKLKISELTPGVEYQIAYKVKLTNEASGWELPITLRLSLPDGTIRERHVSLLEEPRGDWIELKVGSFVAKDGEAGEVCFDLMEHGGHWKIGLIIAGAIFRPKS